MRMRQPPPIVEPLSPELRELSKLAISFRKDRRDRIVTINYFCREHTYVEEVYPNEKIRSRYYLPYRLNHGYMAGVTIGVAGPLLDAGFNPGALLPYGLEELDGEILQVDNINVRSTGNGKVSYIRCDLTVFDCETHGRDWAGPFLDCSYKTRKAFQVVLEVVPNVPSEDNKFVTSFGSAFNPDVNFQVSFRFSE